MAGTAITSGFPSAASCMVYITGREGVESCNTHNMLNLPKPFRMKQDAKYVDFYRACFVQSHFSTQHPIHGGYVYFTPTRPRHYRVYSAPDRDMWCCVGTGMENHTKYGQFIYTHQIESLFVNLFIPSELNWREQGVTIRQETKFPDEEKTVLTVNTTNQRVFRLLIRHPSWLPEGQMKISVDGETVSSDSKPSCYVEIVRTWNGDEKVTVQLPMHFDFEQLINVPAWKAIKRGPIILCAKTPTQMYLISSRPPDEMIISPVVHFLTLIPLQN